MISSDNRILNILYYDADQVDLELILPLLLLKVSVTYYITLVKITKDFKKKLKKVYKTNKSWNKILQLAQEENKEE